MAEQDGALSPIRVEVAICTAPGVVHEWSGEVPANARVADALRSAGCRAEGLEAVGIWGRAVPLTHGLRAGDRVEGYRSLRVDPKVARRERFARQGARSAGLFARKPGRGS